MTQAIFISENWIKNNTPLPTNIDAKEIYPFYKVAQDKYIRDILGDALYNSLSNSIIASKGSPGVPLTALEITLLELIRPSLAYYCCYEAIPFLATKIKNIGVNSTADDKQINAELARVKELRQELLNNAQYYLVRVEKYLCKNHSLYPDYIYTNPDVNPNTHRGYTCDLYIDPCFIDEKFVRQYYRGDGPSHDKNCCND